LLHGSKPARVLQETLLMVPIFLLTAHNPRSAEKAAVGAGIRAVFSKQQDLNSLLVQARAIVGIE